MRLRGLRALALCIPALACSCSRPGPRSASAVATPTVVHETLRVESDGASLAGTLSRPSLSGRVPAVVVLHAAGLERQSDYRTYADSLAARGIAVLAYDMRGVGASTGNPVLPTFGDLASDAMAMTRYLQSRPDIAPHAVGVWALSRGALTAPLLATRDPDVAFLIVVSGPAIPVATLEADAMAGTLRTRGYSEDEVREALGLYRLGVQVARSAQGRDSLERAFQRSRSTRWFPDFPIKAIPPEGHWSWRHFREIVAYDPDTAWARVRVPVLAMYGGRDRPIISADSRARLARALRAGGNRAVTIRVLPEADHLMRAPEGGFARDFFASQSGWILRRAARTGPLQ